MWILERIHPGQDARWNLKTPGVGNVFGTSSDSTRSARLHQPGEIGLGQRPAVELLGDVQVEPITNGQYAAWTDKRRPVLWSGVF